MLPFTVLSALLVALSATASPVNKPELIRLPLTQLSKVQGPAPDAETAKRWDNADLAVWGRDVRYSTKVTLGNPPFEADLIFDTGSSVLWIADIPNDEYNNYSSHSSTTYKNVTDAAGKPTPLDLKYGIGWSRGWVGTETVTFGGQTVKDFKIGAMYDWDRDVTMGGIKGFLGMSWQFYDNLPVLWQTLNKKWAAKEFGVYLQHNPLASGAFPGGVVTLGGADPAYYTGDIHFNPIVGRPQIWDHWLVTIDGLTIGGKKVGKSAMAMIDTGTTQNFGPKEDIDAFYAQIPGSQVFITGKFGSGDHYQYYVPCDFNTPVQVRFGGVSYDMRPEDFIWWRPDGKCVGAFAATEVYPYWFIGQTFLKSVYQVYRSDPPSVGFAKAKRPEEVEV